LDSGNREGYPLSVSVFLPEYPAPFLFSLGRPDNPSPSKAPIITCCWDGALPQVHLAGVELSDVPMYEGSWVCPLGHCGPQIPEDLRAGTTPTTDHDAVFVAVGPSRPQITYLRTPSQEACAYLVSCSHSKVHLYCVRALLDPT
jgi:hypothetical protein